MWQGFRNGLHYINHLKLLTPKMGDISGGLYSLYSFKNDNHFSVSFELSITGEMFTAGDGFLMSLTGQSLPKYGLNFLDANFRLDQDNFTDILSQVRSSDAREGIVYVLPRAVEPPFHGVQRKLWKT